MTYGDTVGGANAQRGCAANLSVREANELAVMAKQPSSGSFAGLRAGLPTATSSVVDVNALKEDDCG